MLQAMRKILSTLSILLKTSSTQTMEHAACEECHQTSFFSIFIKLYASCASHHLARPIVVVFLPLFFLNNFLSRNTYEAVETKGRKPAAKKLKEEKIT